MKESKKFTRPVSSSKKISASLLAADWGRLAYCAHLLEAAGADSIHMDIVDGHFARNLTFGPDAVAAVRKATRLPLAVHLEIDCPDVFLEPFALAGADTIIFHAETAAEPLRTIEQIRRLGKCPGLALTPSKPVSHIEDILHAVPILLLLSVPPGFGGALLNPEIHGKIRQTRELAQCVPNGFEITVDGGVNLSNASALVAAGADVLVSGTYIFASSDPKERIDALRKAIQAAYADSR